MASICQDEFFPATDEELCILESLKDQVIIIKETLERYIHKRLGQVKGPLHHEEPAVVPKHFSWLMEDVQPEKAQWATNAIKLFFLKNPNPSQEKLAELKRFLSVKNYAEHVQSAAAKIQEQVLALYELRRTPEDIRREISIDPMLLREVILHHEEVIHEF